MALSINIFFINGTEGIFNDVVNYDRDNHAINFTNHQEDGSTSDFTFVINSIAGFQEIYTQDELEVEPGSASAVASEPDSDSAVASSSDVVSEPASDSAVSSEPTSEEVDSMADAVSQVSQAVANVDNALSGAIGVTGGINENAQSDNGEAQPKDQPAVFY